MSTHLPWPLEAANPFRDGQPRWFHPRSNICLDFHGDPVNAGLVVFSDGNHHMALEVSLQEFRKRHPDIKDIFYATTPPGVLVNYLKAGQMSLGNLTLSRLPDVFISPPNILQTLQQNGFANSHQAFMRSRGNVLLVLKGNPKQIQGIADLFREDVRVFISNPQTEKASYDVYSETIGLMSQGKSLDPKRTQFGELIHHREAPQCLYDGHADVALIYYHLALRYTRIFPDLFDFIPLGGSRENPLPDSNNVTTTYHIGLINETNPFAQTFMDFMQGDEVTKIYQQHGLERPAS